MKTIWASATCLAFLLAISGLVNGQGQPAAIYEFGANPNDGDIPNGGLVFDKAGNLYGTTQYGGSSGALKLGYGTVFELTPGAGGSWTETVLYNFCSQANCADGSIPLAGLISDNAGNLYGTTASGGSFNSGVCRHGCGTAFELSPPSGGGSSWTERILWNFGETSQDGALPRGRLAWDAQGNLYGTTSSGGGADSLGTVFELSPGSGGAWSENVLYRFCVNGPPCQDGVYPLAGVSRNRSGDLFGTTEGVDGTVFELSPQAGGAWTETTLHHFYPQGGDNPLSEANMDQAGNLYGTVSTGNGTARCGGVWKLAPQSNGTYKGGVASPMNESGAGGCAPMSGVFLDTKTKALYGTASSGGTNNAGVLYEVSPGGKQTVLYNFCQQSGCADGSTPEGSFTQYGSALFSTTSAGGSFNQGVVFMLTP